MKVIVVEENASLRSMIRSILELGHAEVAEASDGASALALYRDYRPDWVLIDLSLKGIDGLDTSARLRRLHPDAKVMLVTDLDSLTLRNKARAAGVDAIVEKERLFDELQKNNFTLVPNVRKF